jgi:translation initiation factor IF-2
MTEKQDKQRDKKRIIDLAKELRLSNTALISLLKELSFPVKSPMSPVSKEMEKAARKKIDAAKTEQKKTLERKKRIWGDERKSKPSSKKWKRFDKERIQDRVKATVAGMGKHGISKPRRKKPPKEIRKKREPKPEKRVLYISGPMSLGELAKIMGIDVGALMKTAMDHGVMATINQTLDQETVMVLAEEYDYQIETQEIEEKAEEEIVEMEEDRAPVVTIMGHVDHGKTTLLDHLREANVAGGEAGGITQHIGAYVLTHDGQKIAFIDTPGHEAFTALRARGAQVTDIVVLIVAGTEGVKPQTVEAINHAKAAQVPIVVAINKMDLPGANADNVKRQLSEYEIIPEDWSGEHIVVEVSAKTGEGVKELLDAILVKAEELDLKTTREGLARGVILEARLERGRGPVASLLLQHGILEVGDSIVAGTASGRVRAMYDEWGKNLTKIGPSTPALVQGLNDVPRAGETFSSMKTDKGAREKASTVRDLRKEQVARGEKTISMHRLEEQLKKGEIKEINAILKADCQGSLEAVSDVLSRLTHEEVQLVLIHQGVGAVTETDVQLAITADGVVIEFNAGIDPSALKLAKSEGVMVKSYDVIYELMEEVREMLAGQLEPEYQEVHLGQVEVREVFRISKVGAVAGCYVLEGTVTRDSRAKVRRDGEVIHDASLVSLKRFKDDVREVQAGYECGIRLDDFNEFKEGDILEIYRQEEVKREF